MAKLYIVGTPIGNMKDITFRALETLQKVDYIACEDTRVTTRILHYFKIAPKKLIIYNDSNENNSAPGIIKLIQAGHNVAQVTDAGMPAISDPGYIVIKKAIASDVQIEIIPGVSAVTSASVLSNFDMHFTFHGFFKYKAQQRKKQLQGLTRGTHIFFASPHRIARELEDIKEVLGPDIKIFIGRELTKKFETHYRGTVQEVMHQLAGIYKGEFTMAIAVA